MEYILYISRFLYRIRNNGYEVPEDQDNDPVFGDFLCKNG